MTITPIPSDSNPQFQNLPLAFRTAKSQQELITLCKDSILDPVLFAHHWLNVETWKTQDQILYSVRDNAKTAAKACHASSKTFTAGIATLWWLARYEEATVITTAPSQNQVEKLLWGEIHKLTRQSLYPFPVPTLTQLKISSKRFALGFTTSVEKGDCGVRFQGFHNKNILVILDEAPGVDGALWEAIEGILSAGNTRLLALGNPIISSGPFFEAFSKDRSNWNTFSISAVDTPNFEGVSIPLKDEIVGSGKNLLEMTPDELAYNPTPYLISRQWAWDRYKEWGVNHPLFVSRVLGRFPSQAPDSLINLEWLLAAKARVKPLTRKYFAGLDVAGPGEDETVLVIRDAQNIVYQQAWPDADPRGDILAALAPFRVGLENVNVDVVGIGYYLARFLEDNSYPVSDVNVAETSSDTDKYANRKAEYYWALRMRLEAGDIAFLTDDTSIAQLAGIRYKPNARGQIQIESKDDARKRGVKSPDRAEAIMLAFAPASTHGLIEYWKELVEVEGTMKRAEVRQVTDPLSLANAQKEALTGEHKDSFTPTQVPKPDPCNPAPEDMPVCRECGCLSIGLFGQGRYRCNGCGKSGPVEELRTFSTVTGFAKG